MRQDRSFRLIAARPVTGDDEIVRIGLRHPAPAGRERLRALLALQVTILHDSADHAAPDSQTPPLLSTPATHRSLSRSAADRAPASTSAPPTLLHEFFDRPLRESADDVALEIPPGRARDRRVTLSYRELAALAVRAQARLALTVCGESLVALLLPRTTADTYAMQLAVLRSGAAYICIDPSFPDDRIAALLADAEPVAIVTNAPGVQRLARIGAWATLVIDVDAEPLHQDSAPGGVHDEAQLAEPMASSAPLWLTPATLAYVVYTSGTTGKPKGVAVEHRAIVNLIESNRDAFGLSRIDRVGQGSSHAYDSSIEEMWMAWSVGAAVVVMDDETVRSGPALVDWLERERLTVLCPPPTLLRSMGLRDAATRLPRLSLLYVGGEALPQDIVDNWAPSRRLVNGYGPTECAVTTVRTDVAPGDPITIGKPIVNVQAWALDASLAVVPDGSQGELCLGGAALARGYWRDAAMTARKFIEHPTLGRLYRTGDLARREPDGSFLCFGRTDTQVKIRGYRVELEDIEAHLSRAPGVRAAACRLDNRENRQLLTAFLVAADATGTPDVDAIREAVSAHLPKALVPSQYLFIDALPMSVSGKLNRDALPQAVAMRAVSEQFPVADSGKAAAGHGDTLEAWVASAMQRVLRTQAPIASDADFFADLGGDSLAAAELAAVLGERRDTETITVGDLYSGPTVEQIAARAREAPPVLAATSARARTPGAHPVMVTTLQTLLLIALTGIASWVGYATLFLVTPALVPTLGVRTTLAVAPFLGLATVSGYALFSAAFAVALKRLLIGRYVPMRTAVWSGYYLRHWIVMRAVGMIPWQLIEGTRLHLAMLRALGARIGTGVHIHRGVRLAEGGWDLLEIGNDVSVGQDVQLHLVDLDDSALVIAPVTLEDGATLEVRSGVGGGARIARNGCLSALSWLPSMATLPAGERWAGVPAEPAGRATTPAPCAPTLSPRRFDLTLLSARAGVRLLSTLPFALAAILVATWHGITTDGLLGNSLSPTLTPTLSLTLFSTLVALGPVPLICMLVVKAVISRALGVVREGAMSLSSGDYVRVVLKTELLTTAGVWLSGTLMWPMWLRAAGARIGRDCEISTIIDVVPEHLVMGESSFLADGIYLGGPRISHGTATLARTTLGNGVFMGNHAVILAGQTIQDGVLLGVATVVDDVQARPGSAWFGQPAFAIRRRPPDEAQRSVTYEPSAIRYINRWLWELLRFALPIPLLVVTFAWISALGAYAPPLSATASTSTIESLRWWLLVPAITFASAAVLPIALLLLKWTLLGRVKPGQHPLWSCWCSRWDFLYVAWGQLVRPVLVNLEGTLLLSAYLRAIGMTIGKRVVLGPGFSQVVDPDMLHFGDDSTVQTMFQAHTFEDRLLKIDTVHIGAGASIGRTSVMMNGSVAGDHTHVAPHTVVMKQARLNAGRRYEGCPSRLVGAG